METKQYTLLLTSLECIKSTTENKKDDVYLKVYVDDSYVGTYYQSSPLKMNEYDTADAKRYLDIEVKVDATSRVKVCLWDKDDGGNADDQMGEITITRDDPIEGNKIAYQTTGDKQSQYKVSWRVLYKPIPTLRVHGIYCQQSSAGCNATVLNAVLEVASTAAEEAAKAIGKVKTPKAIAISKGCKAASKVIDGVALFAEWIANAAEGDDDIYLQHVNRDHADVSQGAFCPPASTNQKNMKMNDEDDIAFYERFGAYFRFPLDKGTVTIKIMDGDRSSGDDCLGSLTIGETEYNRYINAGAQVAVAAEYLPGTGSGQGAVYHICYSVALEDWANPPVPLEDTPISWMSWSTILEQKVISAPAGCWDAGIADCCSVVSGGELWIQSRMVHASGDSATCWGQGRRIATGFSAERPGLCFDGVAKRLDVIARKEDGFAWHATRHSDGWSDWTRLEGMEISTGCTVTTWGNGRLDLFIRGSNGELIHKCTSSSGGWGTGWENLGGTFQGTPSAAAWANRRLDIVVRGMNDTLWIRSYDGSKWLPWVDLGGDPMASSPSLTTTGEGRLECVARAPNGQVMWRSFSYGAWGDWTLLDCGGEIKDAPAISHQGNGQLDVFARSMSDEIIIASKY